MCWGINHFYWAQLREFQSLAPLIFPTCTLLRTLQHHTIPDWAQHPDASLGASNTCRPDADGNIYLLPFCELHLLFRPWLSGAEGKRERRRILVWVVPQQLMPLFVTSFPFTILLGNIVLSNIVDIVSLWIVNRYNVFPFCIFYRGFTWVVMQRMGSLLSCH